MSEESDIKNRKLINVYGICHKICKEQEVKGDKTVNDIELIMWSQKINILIML